MSKYTLLVLALVVSDLSLAIAFSPAAVVSNSKRSNERRSALTPLGTSLHAAAPANSYGGGSGGMSNKPRRKNSKHNKHYVRLLPRSTRGNRQYFELQTAVTTMERTDPATNKKQTVELHAQIHFGEDEYFSYYNSPEFQSNFDSIHYELLVDEHLLETTKKSGLQRRRLPRGTDGKNLLMASPSDRQTAQQYGLACQVDVLDYSSSPKWIHADLTRQEFMSLAAASKKKSSNSAAVETETMEQSPEQPLWALASTAATWPGAEGVAAVFRPATPSTPLDGDVAQRLFSNLFLPGTSLATALRLLFWILVPAPELSVMVLDWSSLLPRPTGSMVSNVALPVLESLLTGNIQEARQLVFGQVIVSGQRSSNNNRGGNNLVIGKRNDHALKVVMDSFENEGNGGKDKHSTALLYGAMHCPDLYNKLAAQGFAPTKTSWRTAWSVRVPNFGTTTSNDGNSSNNKKFLQTFASTVSPNALGVGLVLVPFYLIIGGLDWMATVEQVATSLRNGGHLTDAILAESLYLVRHVALYLGLAKFVVDWDTTGSANLFDER